VCHLQDFVQEKGKFRVNSVWRRQLKPFNLPGKRRLVSAGANETSQNKKKEEKAGVVVPSCLKVTFFNLASQGKKKRASGPRSAVTNEGHEGTTRLGKENLPATSSSAVQEEKVKAEQRRRWRQFDREETRKFPVAVEDTMMSRERRTLNEKRCEEHPEVGFKEKRKIEL